MNERAEGMDRMKLGLVIEGGGMKCAYTAGILDRMLDDEIRPDYVSESPRALPAERRL